MNPHLSLTNWKVFLNIKPISVRVSVPSQLKTEVAISDQTIFQSEYIFS